LKEKLGFLQPVLDTVGQTFQWLSDKFGSLFGWFGSLFEQEKLSDSQKEKMRQSGYDFVNSLFDGIGATFAAIPDWLMN